MVKQARKLKREKGILAIPDPKKGNTLSENSVKLVTGFYQSDENSRVLLGAKDKVSIKKKYLYAKRPKKKTFPCFKSLESMA